MDLVPIPEAYLINRESVAKDAKACRAVCSGAVVAGQEEAEEVGQSSGCHPEHLEKVEGEISKSDRASSDAS